MTRELPLAARVPGGRRVTIVACKPEQGLAEARAARARRTRGEVTYHTVASGNTLFGTETGLTPDTGREMLVVNNELDSVDSRMMTVSPMKNVMAGIQTPVRLIETETMAVDTTPTSTREGEYKRQQNH